MSYIIKIKQTLFVSFDIKLKKESKLSRVCGIISFSNSKVTINVVANKS
jgi:hypothetical protein